METKKEPAVEKAPTPAAPTGSRSKEDYNNPFMPAWVSRVYNAVTISWTVENASLAVLYALAFLILSETIPLKVTVVHIVPPSTYDR